MYNLDTTELNEMLYEEGFKGDIVSGEYRTTEFRQGVENSTFTLDEMDSLAPVSYGLDSQW